MIRKTLMQHPTLVAMALGIEGVDRDTRVILDVAHDGSLVVHVTDEKAWNAIPI